MYNIRLHIDGELQTALLFSTMAAAIDAAPIHALKENRFVVLHAYDYHRPAQLFQMKIGSEDRVYVELIPAGREAYAAHTNWLQRFDNDAMSEGWSLMECPGSESAPFQIQRLDNPEDHTLPGNITPPLLDSDDDAWSIVMQGTKPHHVWARRFIEIYAPDEWQNMLKFKAVRQDAYNRPPHGWTCFHCGETFTTTGSARDHFGAEPTARPGCMLKVSVGAERGLLAELRKLELELGRLYRETPEDPSQKVELDSARAEIAALRGTLGDLLNAMVAYDDGGWGIEEENRPIVEAAFEIYHLGAQQSPPFAAPAELRDTLVRLERQIDDPHGGGSGNDARPPTDDECYTGTGPAADVVGQAGMSDTQEREAHAETNRAMTDALLMMEERDEALLRQALEALESVVEHFDPYMGDNECRPMENARYTITALRERLGKGMEQKA